jgi:hypothetical protein
MAVTFRNNYIEITAGANQSIASGDISAGGFTQLRVRKIRWVAASGAVVGHNAQILDDSGGNVIWEAVVTAIGAGGEFQTESDFVQGFDLRATDLTGLRATVDSGVLYIYLGGNVSVA